MAGLLEEYGLDLDEVEVPSYDVADDVYEFVVSDVYVQKGTDKFPDRSWIVIQYSLGDGGKSKSEWFELPQDSSEPTDKELQKLGFYKNRLLDLGVPPAGVNSVERDELVGVRGTLQVFTNKGYQNIKNVKLEDSGTNDFSESAAPEAPAKTPAAKAPAKAAPAKAPASTVKKNPFGPS